MSEKRCQTDLAGQQRGSRSSRSSRARVPTPTSSLHGIPENGAFDFFGKAAGPAVLDYTNYDTDDWTDDHNSVCTPDGTSVLEEDLSGKVFKYFGRKKVT